MMQGRFDQARRELEAGLERDPQLAEGWNALGVVRSRAGETGQAIEAWRRALELDPRLPDALFNLALALGNSGDLDGAAGALERYVRLVDGEERARAESMLRELRARGGG
jgi:Flp pilus assembly protein TadD